MRTYKALEACSVLTPILRMRTNYFKTIEPFKKQVEPGKE